MPVLFRGGARVVALASLVLALACGSDLALPDGPDTPVAQLSITASGGDAQSGTVGEPLAQSVSVQVADSQGQPVPAVQVAFVPVDSEPGSVVPDTAYTDAAGRAGTRWVLGPRTGPQQLEARLIGGTAQTVVRFVAQASAGLPDALLRISGDAQRGTAGQPLADSLVVEVTDRFGNPVDGVSVAWRVEQGGGTVSARAVNTGADGTAAVQWTLGASPLPQRVTATLNGLIGSPVLFTAGLGG